MKHLSDWSGSLLVVIALFGMVRLSLAAPSSEYVQLAPISISLDCNDFPDGITAQKYALRKAGEKYDQLYPSAGAADYTFSINWTLNCGVFAGSGKTSGQIFKNQRSSFATVFYNGANNYCLKINGDCGISTVQNYPESNADLFGHRIVYGPSTWTVPGNLICSSSGRLGCITKKK